MDGTKNRTEDTVAVMAVRNAHGGGIEVQVSDNRNAAHFWAARGRVRDVDMSSRILSRCVGISEEAAHHLGRGMSPRQCMAQWVAASRELFVRTGTLFCTRRDPCIPVNQEIQRWLEAQRPRVEKLPSNFATVLEAADVFCNLSSLVPLTRWVDSRRTSIVTRTQIFLVGFSRDLRDEIHTPSGFTQDWMAPEHLLVEGQRGHLALDFMAYGCLRTLTDFESVEALFAEYG